MSTAEIFSKVHSVGRTELTEQESRLVFREYGIPVVNGEIAKSENTAVKIAKKMGFPLVMKIASPDILHKTDVGGVVTGIKDLESVRGSYEKIIENAKDRGKSARIDGVMIQPMEKRGLEVIIGGVQDPVFGSIVMFGLGGILTEVLRDVTFGIAPLSNDSAVEMVRTIKSRKLLYGYRGESGVDLESIAQILVQVSKLIEHPQVSEVDANPVFAKEDGAVCVDARIILNSKSLENAVKESGAAPKPGSKIDDDIGLVPKPISKPNEEIGSTSKSGSITHEEIGSTSKSGSKSKIEQIFKPKSVILLGSSKLVKKGGMASPKLFENVGYNLEKFYSGELKIIDIEDYSFAHLEKISADNAVIALPAEQSVEWLPYLNVSSIIQLTGGFSWKQRQTYRDVIKQKNIRMLGPTTIFGVISPDVGFNTSFEKNLMPKQGNIAVLSQSGGVGAVLLDWANYYGIGISRFAFMGEKLDVGDAELLSFLDKDENTRVICIYMEGVKKGREFIKLIKGIRKPIIVLKGGSSEASKKRAASHTASMAGSDEVFNAAFREAGVLRVETIEDLFNGAVALIKQPLMKGKNVAVVSNVGGPAILAADSIELHGLELAELSIATRKKLSSKCNEIFPEPDTVLNPIDTIADADAERFVKILEEVLDDSGVDGVMVINMLKSTFFKPEEALEIEKVVSRFHKPVVDIPAGGEDYFTIKKILNSTDLPTYDLPEKGAKVLRLLYDYHNSLKKKKKKKLLPDG